MCLCLRMSYSEAIWDGLWSVLVDFLMVAHTELGTIYTRILQLCERDDEL